VIFGQCGCSFFRENLLNMGPCAHIAALYRASDGLRVDMPVSTPGQLVAVEKAADADADEDE
jgi:hypothetical protein